MLNCGDEAVRLWFASALFRFTMFHFCGRAVGMLKRSRHVVLIEMGNTQQFVNWNKTWLNTDIRAVKRFGNCAHTVRGTMICYSFALCHSLCGLWYVSICTNVFLVPSLALAVRVCECAWCISVAAATAALSFGEHVFVCSCCVCRLYQ